MGAFNVKSPDGQEYEVNAPEGATEQQAIEFVQREMAAGRLAPKIPPQADSVIQSATEPLRRLPGDVMNESRKSVEELKTDVSGMRHSPTLGGKAAAAGGAAMDLFNIPVSPIKGATRALVGRPVSKVLGKPELEDPITENVTNAELIFGPAAAKAGKAMLHPVPPAYAPEMLQMTDASKKLSRPISAAEVGNVRDGNIAEAYRAISQVSAKGRELLGEGAKDSMKIVHAIQSGDLWSLTPQEREAAEMVSGVFANLAKAGTDSQVLPRLKMNYVPQIWDLTDKHTKSVYDKLIEASPVGAQSTTFTPFSLKSSIESYEEGLKLGMKPKYTDIFKIMEEYGKSVVPAIEQSKMLSALKELKGADGKGLVIALDGQKPDGWITARHPDLQGYAYHPELAPSIQMLVDSYEPSVVMKSLQLLSGTTKRLNVSMSYFHANSLFQAWLGTGGNPHTVKSAIDASKKAYLTGEPGDTISLGLRHGLKVDAPLEDRVGQQMLQKVLSKVENVPAIGGAAKGVKAIDDHFNRFTWEYLHTGMKLETFGRVFESEKAREIAQLIKNPTYKMRTDAQIAETVSAYVNSIFRGLDWRRMAESVQNPLFRKYAAWAATKQGQAGMQATLFAPDWTTSTIQAWTRAIPGVAEPELRRLHQSYIGRSAIMTAMISDAINYQASGHHIWQNHMPGYERGYKESWQDKLHAMTWIDLGDGLHMQAFKHFMEGPHFVADPAGFVRNKFAAPIQVAGSQLMGTEYLSPYAPKMHGTGDRLKNLARRVMPFTGSGFADALSDGGRPAWMGLTGFVGAPISGSTTEERIMRKIKEREQKVEERQ